MGQTQTLIYMHIAKALNTMIMTEDRVKSSTRNASTQASIGGSHPYNLLAKKSFRQQRC